MESQKQYCKNQIKYLLNNFNFLREHPTEPHFSSKFFQNYVLNIVLFNCFNFTTHLDLVEYMDNIFCFAAASILCAFHDLKEGCFYPRDVSGELWLEYYGQVKVLMERMCHDKYLNAWLAEIQLDLFTWGQRNMELLVPTI